MKQIKLTTFLFGIPTVIGFLAWLITNDTYFKWLDVKMKIIITLTGIITSLVSFAASKVMIIKKQDKIIKEVSEVAANRKELLSKWINQDTEKGKLIKLYEANWMQIGYLILSSQLEPTAKKLSLLHEIYNKISEQTILGGEQNDE